MRGEELKSQRESQGQNQPQFAAWLNEQLGRRYDKAKISRWESNREAIPDAVVSLLLRTKSAPSAEGHGPAFTVALANRKGGVGKTVTATNVASLLAMRGHKVLLVDVDPQANATISCGVNVIALEKQEKTLYHPLRAWYAHKQQSDIRDYVVEVPATGVHVLPASMRLSDTENELPATNANYVLREFLAEARRQYDVILIDCPPHFGRLTINALTAADAVLIPCQTEMLAVMGVEFLLENIDEVRRYSNPRLSILGILPTMYSAQLTENRASLEDMHKKFGRLVRIFDPMPRATVYAQAVAAGRAAVEAAPDAPGMDVYGTLVDAIIQERAHNLEVTHVA